MKDRIKNIMEHYHLTRTDFAKMTGISPASLSQILNGKQMATMKTVEAIHRAFTTIPLDWLMFGTGEMIPAGQDSEQAKAQDGVVQAESVQPQDMGGYVQPSLFPTEDNRRTKDYANKNVHFGGVKNADMPRRYITEIRVFYSDGTYESFAGNKQ